MKSQIKKQLHAYIDKCSFIDDAVFELAVDWKNLSNKDLMILQTLLNSL
jgi:hypothetical protein